MNVLVVDDEIEIADLIELYYLTLFLMVKKLMV